MEPIRIGTRGSKLALWQANWVKSRLERMDARVKISLVVIKTKGDKILDVPLAKVGGKGLFVKEIEEALLENRIDLAVHSMKDMPAEIPEGLCIGAVPERETPQDVLISRNATRFPELPVGAKIGTSSLRRSAQLLHARRDIAIVPLRGNLDTRIRKLESESLDAIVLAAAGVKRMGMEHRITEILDESMMLPAVGQGALCIESRRDDPKIHSLISLLDHHPTRVVVTAERAFLKRLEGGCQVPMAAFGKISGTDIHLTGLVVDTDGSSVYRQRMIGPIDQPEALGIALSEALLKLGAKAILDKLKMQAI